MAQDPDRSKVEAYLPVVAALAAELGDPAWPSFTAVQEANLVLMEVVAEPHVGDLSEVLRVRIKQRFEEIGDRQQGLPDRSTRHGCTTDEVPERWSAPHQAHPAP